MVVFLHMFTAYIADSDSALVERYTGHDETVGAFVLSKDLKTMVTCKSFVILLVFIHSIRFAL